MTNDFGAELVRKMVEQYQREQAQNIKEVYDEGYDDGYEDGYEDGYDDCECDSYADYDCNDEPSCNCGHCKSKQTTPIMANITTPYGILVVGASDWQDFKNAIDAIENTIG